MDPVVIAIWILRLAFLALLYLFLGAVVRVLMRPGLALQQLTTREPTLDQLEVAITSLRAVMTAEQLAEVEGRVPTRAAMPSPAFGTA